MDDNLELSIGIEQDEVFGTTCKTCLAHVNTIQVMQVNYTTLLNNLRVDIVKLKAENHKLKTENNRLKQGLPAKRVGWYGCYEG